MNNFEAFAIFIAIIILMFMAVGLIAFIVFYQKKQFRLQIRQQQELQEIEARTQKRLLKNSLEVQEAERDRISKDLHDDIGGLLSASKLSIQLLGRSLKKNPEYLEGLNNSKELVTEALSQVRSLSKDLTPRTLKKFGLSDALFEFTEKMSRASSTEIHLEVSGLDSLERLDEGIELTIYRVVQELINNALKHAKASEINVQIERTENELNLKYLDDGIGFDFEAKSADLKSGLGLGNIISRVNVVNGTCDFFSKPQKGTRVDIKLPLKNNSHE
ncbi:sensor histidine kinase [Jiulongibacter sp. NS-SX5]|uniref:sensor histidine kinase n=1 Tax=Jiulongibacter sp. NS-SX5 TaxID=3463854 RepID=UPI004058CBE6